MSEQPISSNVVSMTDHLARKEAQKAEPRFENDDEVYLRMASSYMKPYAEVNQSEIKANTPEITEEEKQILAIHEAYRELKNVKATRRNEIGDIAA